MNYIFIILGILILLAAALDMTRTIIFMNGAGNISKWLAKTTWKIFFLISGRNGKSRFLTFSGGTILMLLIFLWVLMIWLGYSLIYLADYNSVVDATTEEPADIVGNIYYVGYSLTSLGNGDLKAGSDFWRIISNILGITSMFFVTVGISYLLPVLQAVIDKRSLAIYISKLGKTPEEILNESWNGNNFSGLYERFTNLETTLIKHAERHLAYPILHYFHNNKKDYSAPLRLAVLDEVLTIQEIYKIDQSSNVYQWKVLRGALDNYIERLDNTFIGSSDEPPAFPYKDFPNFTNVSKADLEVKLQPYKDRRCKLLGLIKKDGWEWTDVTGIAEERIE